jgi:formylglycine-generating enzyme required for sulfatase activity
MNHKIGNWWVVVATAWSVSAGCEKARREQTPAPTPAKDARVVALDASPVDAAVDARDDGPEPLVPPPPPTVKRNGKGDCSVEYAPRPTRDPNPLCKIAGGSFMMGSADPKAEANERPVRKVTLTSYFIDQFEVTNAQVAHFLNAVGNQCANGFGAMCFATTKIADGAPLIEAGGNIRARRNHERRPVHSASVEGAQRYCAWVGKRLPTEAEWEFAARHDPKTNKDYRWPWGDKFFPKRAACDEEVCKDGFKQIFNDENSSDEAPVGTFDGTHGFGDGSSPWGVHDMAGNVSEIMADVTDADQTPYVDCGRCIDPVMAKTGADTFHVTRGPSGAVTYNAGIATRGGGTGVIEGFRCAYR